jgi:AsmA protein
MRALKIAAWVLGGLIGLIVIGLVLIVVFVHPNDYRDDIERVVQDETGRKLSIEGDLKLSVFPWLALETGAASLGESRGFGTEPFASIKRSHIGVKVLPLLRGTLEVGSVKLEGARIHLITDAQGRKSWADLGSDSSAEAKPDESGQPTTLPTIASLAIDDAAVTIDNQQDKTHQSLRNFNLETGRLASGEPFKFKTDFIFESTAAGEKAPLAVKVAVASTITADLEKNAHQLAKPEIDLTVSGPGYPAEGVPIRIRAESLDAEVSKELYTLAGFALTTTWKGEGFPASGIPIALNAADASVNLAAQTLALTGMQLDVAGGKISGSLKGEEILDAPRFAGPLELDTLSLRDWLPKLGVTLPTTRDPNVFRKFAFAANLAATKTSASLNDVTLTLDDTTMKGMVAVADLASKALRFDLNIDSINADRYLAPPVDTPAAKTDPTPPTEIPVDMLRALNARGDLRVGAATFAGMKFSKLRLGLNARDGKVRFNPSEASMYGGQYSGDIGIDATGKVARVTLDEHVSAVDFAPLFKDLFKSDRVSGKGGMNLKLAGTGRTTDDIMKTLDGNLDFKVADGALNGADLWYEIRRARALLKQQAAPERTGPERTAFSALQGTGVMKSGVLSNNDLNIAMQYLKVTGGGTVDLPKNALDYKLNAIVLKIPREGVDTSQMQDMVDAEIPVKVTGALTDPKVRPDVEGYLKAKVNQRVDEERKKLEQKAKDKLGDKLKDLFKR